MHQQGAQMPGGNFFGAVFFGSLILAGFTSIISILQVVSGAMQDKFGLGVRQSAVAVSLVCGVISIALFSTNSGLHALDTVDQWANNVGIVLSAIVMTVLVVWVFRKSETLRRPRCWSIIQRCTSSIDLNSSLCKVRNGMLCLVHSA